MTEFMSNEEEEISAQLNTTLRASVTAALSSRRPILTHLNADTTWLLSLPIPYHNVRNRIYYHILIDPWLCGSQSDVAKFFSQQWHKEESVFQTIGDIEQAIKGFEEAALGKTNLERSERSEYHISDGREPSIDDGQQWIDAVIISHEFTDHMHKGTLLEIPPNVPVFATAKAASSIRSWNHFLSVGDISRFTGSWTESSASRLPQWLSITRLAYAGQDLLYYHSAIMIAFEPYSKSDLEDSIAECVIYTPHGITPRDIEKLVAADPAIKTLALLHGLQEISLPKAQLNLGAHNGLKIQRLLRTKYWISTHDEVKTGGGIISWFLNRKIITLEEAFEKEKKEKKEKGDNLEGTGLESMADVRFVELGNGESMILE